ncbi:MAG: HAMP domain-containing histidine kinase [Ardenticatenaceae bacterium]|nr:HAMP domain-containing histidine kinase [Ardenticatenaceae bacterium]
MAEHSENEYLEQLLHAINHDLRTPLSNIRSAVSILMQDLADPLTEDQRKFVEIIDHSTSRLLDQSNRLMLLNQIAFGQLKFELAPISELLANVRKTLKNSYEIEEITFVTDGDPQIQCDSYILSATLAMLAAGDTKQQLPRLQTHLPAVHVKAKTDTLHFTIHSLMDSESMIAPSFLELTKEIVRQHGGELTLAELENRQLFSFTLSLTTSPH